MEICPIFTCEYIGCTKICSLQIWMYIWSFHKHRCSPGWSLIDFYRWTTDSHPYMAATRLTIVIEELSAQINENNGINVYQNKVTPE